MPVISAPLIITGNRRRQTFMLGHIMTYLWYTVGVSKRSNLHDSPIFADLKTCVILRHLDRESPRACRSDAKAEGHTDPRRHRSDYSSISSLSENRFQGGKPRSYPLSASISRIALPGCRISRPKAPGWVQLTTSTFWTGIDQTQSFSDSSRSSMACNVPVLTLIRLRISQRRWSLLMQSAANRWFPRGFIRNMQIWFCRYTCQKLISCGFVYSVSAFKSLKSLSRL